VKGDEMSRRQTDQHLDTDTVDRLSKGDPEARLDQMLVSAQNYVVGQRSGYNRALLHRAECIALAHAAGWSKYRIAQRLGITRRAVDEALTRPSRSPSDFLAAQVQRNGGLENESDRRLKQLLHEVDDRAEATAP
jgi:lambda repressor-like predicted transcriptional regulator